MNEQKKLSAMLLRRIGASKLDEAELYHQESRDLDISAFEQEITGFTRSRREGLGARVQSGGRIGSSFTEEMHRKAIDQALQRASEQLEHLPADPAQVLYPGDRVLFDVSRENPGLSLIPVEQKKEFVLKLERAARSMDKKILNVPQARYVESQWAVTVVNGRGMKKIQLGSWCGAFLQVTAGNSKQVHSYSVSAADTSFYELSPLRLAQEAAAGALEKMNPKGIESGTYPVVFSQDTASRLLGAFIGAGRSHFFGENVQKGRSRFAGRLQQSIASPLFTVYDNPGGSSIFSRSFDDEGFPAGKLVLVHQGILKAFAHSIYSAKMAGTSPTGHSMRSGYSGVVSTGLHAPCLTNGEQELEELFDICGEGIYITELEGLHAGLDPLTGDFSLSARGFRIEKGKLGKPVGQCIAAGNFFDLISSIKGKSGDRRENTFQRFSSPAVLVSSLWISG